MKTALIIPARYGSSRFPGKPLAMIAGQTMLARTVAVAQKAAKDNPDTQSIVATDDERIMAHAAELGVRAVLTPESCASGTDRVACAAAVLEDMPDFIINLQGDAPLTPPSYLRALIGSFESEPCDIVTPAARLSWDELDSLRVAKKVTPFSGTCVVFDEKTGRAHWFSKNIIPAIRKEDELRRAGRISPVWRHIGIYGYSPAALQKLNAFPEGHYEKLEGLEQLRALENGMPIRCVPVESGNRPSVSGIDCPEDIARAESILIRDGKEET